MPTIRSVRSVREIVKIYDALIRQASNNIGKKIKVEWGTWIPTIKGLSKLVSRRNKLKKGNVIDFIKLKGTDNDINKGRQ